MDLVGPRWRGADEVCDDIQWWIVCGHDEARAVIGPGAKIERALRLVTDAGRAGEFGAQIIVGQADDVQRGAGVRDLREHD